VAAHLLPARSAKESRLQSMDSLTTALPSIDRTRRRHLGQPLPSTLPIESEILPASRFNLA
jgi:hypothetical protein